MSPTSGLPNLLSWFGPSLLIALIWCVAGLIALARWKRHPIVSLLVLLASVLLLASGVVGNLATYALINASPGSGGPSSLGMSALTWGRTVLSGVGFVLLVCAVFGWRREPVPRDFGEDRWRGRHDDDRFGEIGRRESDGIELPRQ